LSLEQIYQKVKAPKTTIYRLLKTCVHRGYVAQGTDGLYRLSSQPKKMRFGFAAQSSDMPFSEIVTSSLKAAAMRNGIELLVLDNHYDPEIAVRNAERLVQEQVDLVIEFQIEHSVAAIISDKIAVAGIPLVAVDMPHPHATYFGADNYRLGYSAGEALARYAIKHWKSKVRWVLGLDLEQAGAFVQNRTTGAFNGIRSLLPDLEIESFVRMDSRGLRDKSYKLVLEFLTRHPKDKGILIAAHNDTVALGAVQAVRELHLEQSVAVAGQDGIAEAMEEMMRAGQPAGRLNRALCGELWRAVGRSGTEYSARAGCASLQFYRAKDTDTGVFQGGSGKYGAPDCEERKKVDGITPPAHRQ
jgi:ribose transport system substrate-binding protein